MLKLLIASLAMISLPLTSPVAPCDCCDDCPTDCPCC
jgi:hypothetical protein